MEISVPSAADRYLLAEGRDLAWEDMHEASKTSRHEPHVYFGHHPSDIAVTTAMRRLREVKPYTDCVHVPMPYEFRPAVRGLDDAQLARTSARSFGGGELGLADLAKALQHAYGRTHDERASGFPREFRAVPSGGALFPLELYVAAREVSGLQPGLYHYDPVDHELDVLGPADVASCFVQSELVCTASAVVLLSAVFFRSTFKYGDRGYRFVLLEAGHVAQNIILTATGLGGAAVPIGGYFDREVDDVLGVNGIDESVVYAVLLGSHPEET
jgi:SagB-type dehydrogenase family enzyme